MKSKYTLSLVLVFAAVILLNASALFAQEIMKYEDYLVELQQWQQREQAAQAQIAQLETEIAALRQRLADLDRQINDTTNQMWRALQTNERAFQDYLNQLNRLRDQLRGLLNLSPGDLYRRGDEAERARQQFENLSNNPAGRHPDARSIIQELERLMNRLETALENAVPPYDTYTVVRGDYLYRISGKAEIYNDPFQWVKIWSKNRELVKNPDLIYPDWNLMIPRALANNEYLVVRGDNLSKIAQQLYNDPFQWSRLFEANQDIIMNKDVIYPHMILIKP